MLVNGKTRRKAKRNIAKVPTMRWVFECFEGINFVQTAEVSDKDSVYVYSFDKQRKNLIRPIGRRSLYLYNMQK
jgi:hypothetical protein